VGFGEGLTEHRPPAWCAGHRRRGGGFRKSSPSPTAVHWRPVQGWPTKLRRGATLCRCKQGQRVVEQPQGRQETIHGAVQRILIEALSRRFDPWPFSLKRWRWCRWKWNVIRWAVRNRGGLGRRSGRSRRSFVGSRRDVYPGVHRAMGYLYLSAVFLAGSAGLWLSPDTPVFAAHGLTDPTALDLSMLGLSPSFLPYSASSRFSPNSSFS